jgi:hypothetical protein
MKKEAPHFTNQNHTQKTQRAQRPPMKKEALHFTNQKRTSKTQGAPSPPTKRGFTLPNPGTYPKHYHEDQSHFLKKNFARRHFLIATNRNTALHCRLMTRIKPNHVNHNISHEGDIINILHEGESGSFD